jgi:hypothetical protein
MKKLLFLILILIVGLLVYFTYFTTDTRQEYEAILLPFVIYLFFAFIFYLIIKRAYDFTKSR